MNKETIEKTTLEQFEEMLNRIEWKITGNHLNRHIRDHNGKSTHWSVRSDRVEFNDDYANCAFYFKDSMIEFLDERHDCVSISALGRDSVFILFMNHNLSKKEL